MDWRVADGKSGFAPREGDCMSPAGCIGGEGRKN